MLYSGDRIEAGIDEFLKETILGEEGMRYMTGI